MATTKIGTHLKSRATFFTRKDAEKFKAGLTKYDRSKARIRTRQNPSGKTLYTVWTP